MNVAKPLADALVKLGRVASAIGLIAKRRTVPPATC